MQERGEKMNINKSIQAVAEEEVTQADTLETIKFIQLSEEELRKERVPSLADTLECQIVGTETEYTLQKASSSQKSRK